jgi:hypothetical protein
MATLVVAVLLERVTGNRFSGYESTPNATNRSVTGIKPDLIS